MRADQFFWSLGSVLFLAFAIIASLAYAIPFAMQGEEARLGYLWDDLDNPTRLYSHVIAWLVGSFTTPFAYLLSWLGVRRLRGEAVGFGDLVDFRGCYVKWVEFNLLLGLIGKSVPGYWWWLLWIPLYPIIFIAPIVMIDKRVKAIEAIRIACRSLWPSYGMAILVFLASHPIAVGGGLLCGVGLLLTIPLYFLVPSQAYHALFDPLHEVPETLFPSTRPPG